MKRYTFEDLETLPPDHVFSKITDKMMKCDGNTKSQNKVRWAEEWLKRREDKLPSTIRISQNISIQDAFNQLSNEQLNEWINIYRKKVHKHQDNCTQKEAVTTYYRFEDLKTLPSDHVFSKIKNKMIHGGDGKNLVKQKVAWAEEWLKRRDDSLSLIENQQPRQ